MIRFSLLIAVLAWAAPAAAQEAGLAVSLSFDDAVRSAEPASESVTIARSEVDRAQASIVSARSGYLPTINGTASYQRTLASQFDNISFGPPPAMDGESDDTLGGLPFGQRNNWNLGVQVSQPLFDGFRTRAGVRQATAGARAAQLGVKSTKAQAVLQVAQAYFDAVLAQRQVDIAEVTLKQTEETLAETQLGFKHGTMPEFDVLRAEVARDNQRTLIVRYQVQRDVALVYLRRLIGMPSGTPVALTTSLERDDVENVAAAARAAAGIQAQTASRVAIDQAKQGVALQQAAVEAAKADLLPSIAAISDLGFVNYENQPFNRQWFTNWTLGVALNVPIFDGFRRRATIRQNEANLAGARAQLQQATEVSQVEAEQARASVAASLSELESSARTVKQARRAYEIAELRFAQGASTHLELIDARIQLEQALLNEARSARDLRVARLQQELLPALPLGATGGL